MINLQKWGEKKQREKKDEAKEDDDDEDEKKKMFASPLFAWKERKFIWWKSV